MKFIQKKDEWYPDGFWVSESGNFSLGYTQELFNRNKLQVMSYCGDGWSVIREYVSYEVRLFRGLLFDIQKCLSLLPESVSSWKDVDELLPKFNVKYLEDVGNESFQRKWGWSKKEKTKLHTNNDIKLSTDSEIQPNYRAIYGTKVMKKSVDNFGS